MVIAQRSQGTHYWPEQGQGPNPTRPSHPAAPGCDQGSCFQVEASLCAAVMAKQPLAQTLAQARPGQATCTDLPRLIAAHRHGEDFNADIGNEHSPGVRRGVRRQPTP